MTALFKAVLNMSITGAVIICAVSLMRLFMKRLPKKYSYALWIIPALRLLCPFSISSAVSFFNLLRPRVSENRMTYIPEPPADYVPPVYIAPPAANAADTFPVIPETAVQPVKEQLDIMSVLPPIWAAGCIIMLIITLVTYANVFRRVKFAVKKGEYYLCENIDSPFVFGVFRPKIYIPSEIDGTDLECILAHENTHIRRFDHIVKLLCIPVVLLHWFNPFIWLGIKLMTEDMELSCDEAVLKNSDTEYRKTYANALLNMSVKQNRLSPGVLSFGETDIRARVKGALTVKKNAAVISIIAVIILVFTAASMLTNAKNTETTPSGEIQTDNTPVQGEETPKTYTYVSEETDLRTALMFGRLDGNGMLCINIDIPCISADKEGKYILSHNSEMQVSPFFESGYDLNEAIKIIMTMTGNNGSPVSDKARRVSDGVYCCEYIGKNEEKYYLFLLDYNDSHSNAVLFKTTDEDFTYEKAAEIISTVKYMQYFEVPDEPEETEEDTPREYIRTGYYRIKKPYISDSGEREEILVIDSPIELENFANEYIADLTDISLLLFGHSAEWFSENRLAVFFSEDGDGTKRYTVGSVGEKEGKTVIEVTQSNPLFPAYSEGETGLAYLIPIPKKTSEVRLVHTDLPAVISKEEIKAISRYLWVYHSRIFDGGLLDFNIGFGDVTANEDIRAYSEASAEYCQLRFNGDMKFINIVPNETAVSVLVTDSGNRVYTVPYAREIDAFGEYGDGYYEGQTGYIAYIELEEKDGELKVSRAVTGGLSDTSAFGDSCLDPLNIDSLDFGEGAEYLNGAIEWKRTPHNFTVHNWNTHLRDVTLPDLETPEKCDYRFLEKCERVAVLDEKACGEYKVQLVAEYVFKDSGKDPGKIFCCNEPMIRFVCGNSTEAADFFEYGYTGIAEFDENRLSDYLTVFEMGGAQLIMLKYNGMTSFYRSIHDTPYRNVHGSEIFGFRFEETDNTVPDRLNISEDISVDAENRTLTDNASGTVYLFDFDSSTYKTE